MLISLFGHILKLVIKILFFSYYFHLFNSLWFTKISLMQSNIRKSLNNTLASPVRELNNNLGKIAHIILKETHRPHNSVTKLDMANVTSCFFQCFITRPLLITGLRYLALFNFFYGIFYYIPNAIYWYLMILFWKKNIPTTFSQGCTCGIHIHQPLVWILVIF